MNDRQYERTVAAALAETASKFKLAEALALDIPPRHRGPDPRAERTVPEYLADARQAITDAGGEPRSAETLATYRKTAVWVSVPGDRNPEFRWVPGASFTAHRRAMEAGLSWETFAALPEPTGDAANEAAGRAPIRGTSTMDRWTAEQRAAAARELVAGLPPEQQAELASQAATGLPPAERAKLARQVYDREARDADRDRADAIRAELEAGAPVITDPAYLDMQARTDAMTAITIPLGKALTLLRPVPEAAEALGARLDAGSRESVHVIGDELVVILEMIKLNVDQAAEQEAARKGR